MLDTLRLLATQPVLRGRNVAVISNSRSPQTLAEMALQTAGLIPVPPPVTVDWRSTPDDFTAAIAAALRFRRVDGLLVIHAPPMPSAVGAPVDEIDAALAGATKPVAVVLLGASDGPIRPGSPVPGFSFPEPAAAVLGRSYAYGHWLDTEAAASPALMTDVDGALVDARIAAALAEGRLALDVAETTDVLRAYGIAMPPTRYVRAADAVDAAAAVGYPVAIKARQRHAGRSVEAGVALDLVDAGDVTASITRMRAALGDHADFVLVQAMVDPGVDVRVKITADPDVGPLIAVGLGGTQADLITEESSRLAPLSTESAVALLADSRVGPSLRSAGIGSGHLVDLVLRAAQLAAEHAEFGLVDLNPVIVTATGCQVTDAMIRVAPVARPDAALRRLES